MRWQHFWFSMYDMEKIWKEVCGQFHQNDKDGDGDDDDDDDADDGDGVMMVIMMRMEVMVRWM